VRIIGGRCGCRSTDAALALAQKIHDLPGLRLRGLELYEGVLHGDDPQPQVEALLRDAAELACHMENLVDGEFILTGAGTVWYDVVCDIWLAAKKPAQCRIVIRPGCYITHDRGIYADAQQTLIERDRVACDLGGDLASALELVAMVQSVPEADRRPAPPAHPASDFAQQKNLQAQRHFPRCPRSRQNPRHGSAA